MGAGARIDLGWRASGGGLCVRHRVLGCAPEDMGGAAVKEDRGVGPASGGLPPVPRTPRVQSGRGEEEQRRAEGDPNEVATWGPWSPCGPPGLCQRWSSIRVSV